MFSLPHELKTLQSRIRSFVRQGNPDLRGDHPIQRMVVARSRRNPQSTSQPFFSAPEFA
jgi:hypothetical protein